MNILVTGAAGFIGKNFVIENFNSSCKFICVDKLTYAADISFLHFVKKNDIAFYNNDINDTQFLLEQIHKHKVDLIVNFAAETHVDNSIRDVQPFVSSNINGVVSILEILKKTSIKLLHVSTDEVYGPASDYSFKEEDRLNPQNPYAVTKAAAEMMINSYKNTFGINAWIVRPTNNFGEGQNVEKFIPKYITHLQNNKGFPLYGDGNQIREWLYVKDTAKIVFEISNKILKNEKVPYVLNLGSENTSKKNIDVCREVFNQYKTNSCSNDEFERTIDFVVDRPGHDKKYAIDCSKLKIVLPNFKFSSFQEAIRKTIHESLY